MRKYYIYTVIAIIAIFALQAINIQNTYDSFIKSEGTKIEESLVKALDIEHYRRDILSHSDTVTYELKQTPIGTMSKQQRDSLIAIHPIPTTPPPTHDLIELMNKGRIKSFSDLNSQMDQDRLFENGSHIDASNLDSILIAQNRKNYPNNIYIYDNTNNLLSSCSNIKEGVTSNYQSGLISVSLKGYQSVRIETHIPMSRFFAKAYYTLILSALITLIPLGILIYLITSISKREKQSKLRELTINGVIHDLKSPLAGVSAMLDFFRITETNQDKIKIINSNKTNIHFLTQRIKVLLSQAKGKRLHISVNKEPIKLSELIDRGEKIKLLLLQKKWGKRINVSFVYGEDKQVYVDTLHYDTILLNLIENSIKYSNDNVEIIVKLSLTGNNIVINIKDNGFGINRHDFNRIFNPNYHSPHKNIEGYCIGLSYIRTVAQALRGNAYLVNSEIGKGSEFEVTFNIEA